MDLELSINQLADEIRTMDSQREVLGKALSSIKKDIVFPSGDSDIFEDKFVTKIIPHDLKKLKIGAVDGGIVQTKLHGMNLVVGRAVGVIFDFEAGHLFNTNYAPDAFPSVEVLPFNVPISEREYGVSVSINRQVMEMKRAREVVEKFSPEIMVLDGSVLPLAMDKPEKGSSAFAKYENLIGTYLDLYNSCEKKGAKLAGVIEDSSGERLTKLLREKIVPGIIKGREFDDWIIKELDDGKRILEKTNDSNIIYYILDVGERTCIYSYSKDPVRHAVLQDLENFSDRIYSFYLKTVPFDRPVRIDFVSGSTERKEITKTANEIASAILALSMHNETYGFPSIMIEADARARLSENDLNMVYSRIKDKVGDLPSLFKLRRELRPF
jgi:hypothetical protein